MEVTLTSRRMREDLPIEAPSRRPRRGPPGRWRNANGGGCLAWKTIRIASRHAAYEAVLREVLFHAEGPDELLQLAGASSVELPARGSPEQSSGDEEELLFGVEV